MRIWIVNHYALPPGASGGPTRHLGLARALRDLGHDVVIHASVFDHYTRADHRQRRPRRHLVEDIEGITYVWWSTPPYTSMPARVRNMLVFAARVARQGAAAGLPAPDVVLGSSPHLFAGWAARRLARHFKVPFVFEVRDLWPQTFVEMGELGARHPAILLLRRLESSLYRSADRIITVLPGAGEYISARGGSTERIAHIPNGVDLDLPPPPRELAASGAGFTVVYAGTIGHANGLEVAVDAAAELARRGRTEIRMRLVGAGPERESLRARAADLHLQNLTIEGPIASAEVPALLATADACLLVLRPSPVFRWGVSPTKLFDYLAAERPVVASVSAPDDIVGPARAGIWGRAGDPRALADAIETLADLPAERRAEMGRSGRRYVEGRHDFPQLAMDLVAVLESSRAEHAVAP